MPTKAKLKGRVNKSKSQNKVVKKKLKKKIATLEEQLTSARRQRFPRTKDDSLSL